MVGIGSGMEFMVRDTVRGLEAMEGDEEEVNGEVVREGMERWRTSVGMRGAVWGTGWVMGMVGLWGDRF